MKIDEENGGMIKSSFTVTYTPDKDSKLEFEVRRDHILHKIGERYVLSPINLPSFNTNSFLVTHSNRHDFSMYFADIFPLGLPPRKEQEPQRIFPKVRMLYPASSINSLLDLIVKTVTDSEKSSKTEDQPKAQKIIPYRYYAFANIPTFYANACLIYYNQSTTWVRMVFGYATKGNLTLTPNGEPVKNVAIIDAVADIQMDIMLLKSMVDPLENQIMKFNKKYGKRELELEEEE